MHKIRGTSAALFARTESRCRSQHPCQRAVSQGETVIRNQIYPYSFQGLCVVSHPHRTGLSVRLSVPRKRRSQHRRQRTTMAPPKKRGRQTSGDSLPESKRRTSDHPSNPVRVGEARKEGRKSPYRCFHRKHCLCLRPHKTCSSLTCPSRHSPSLSSLLFDFSRQLRASQHRRMQFLRPLPLELHNQHRHSCCPLFK